MLPAPFCLPTPPGWPRLCRHLLVWPPIRVLVLHVRLVGDAVQVLVQPVQQEGQQLLAVLLRVPAELGRKLGQLPPATGGARGPGKGGAGRSRQAPCQDWSGTPVQCSVRPGRGTWGRRAASRRRPRCSAASVQGAAQEAKASLRRSMPEQKPAEGCRQGIPSLEQLGRHVAHAAAPQLVHERGKGGGQLATQGQLQGGGAASRTGARISARERQRPPPQRRLTASGGCNVAAAACAAGLRHRDEHRSAWLRRSLKPHAVRLCYNKFPSPGCPCSGPACTRQTRRSAQEERGPETARPRRQQRQAAEEGWSSQPARRQHGCPAHLHERPAVQEALQRGVHEARVAQVAQARQPMAPALALQAGE